LTFAASSASRFVSLIRSLSSVPGVSLGRSAPCCFVVGAAPDSGAAPTEGVAPGPDVSLDDVGLSEEVAEVGLWMEVTPVLSVSCSERIGPVAGVFPVVVLGREEDSGPLVLVVEALVVEVVLGSAFPLSYGSPWAVSPSSPDAGSWPSVSSHWSWW